MSSEKTEQASLVTFQLSKSPGKFKFLSQARRLHGLVRVRHGMHTVVTAVQRRGIWGQYLGTLRCPHKPRPNPSPVRHTASARHIRPSRTRRRLLLLPTDMRLPSLSRIVGGFPSVALFLHGPAQ